MSEHNNHEKQNVLANDSVTRKALTKNERIRFFVGIIVTILWLVALVERFLGHGNMIVTIVILIGSVLNLALLIFSIRKEIKKKKHAKSSENEADRKSNADK